ncbi:MAG: hypothetical protein H7Y07_18495 [Pyrinomonadaceae bacterium]|nr:hypothetical protein [Sphingobacteriaceae bacterium]
MKMIKNTVITSFSIALLGASSVFAQTLADAKKAIDAEQYLKASTILKSLTATQPASAENYFHLGNLYLTNEYPDSAKTTFTTGISKDPKFALNYVGLGAVELSANNTTGAKTNFDKAIASSAKKDNDAYIFAAKAYIAAPNPNYAAAIPYLEKAIAIDAKDAEAYLALGDAYRGQNKNSEAYGAYRTASDLNKSLLRPQVELAVLTKRAMAWQESIDAFNTILKANATYGPAYRELADTYVRWANKSSEINDYRVKIKQGLDNYIKYMDLTDRSVDSRVRYAGFLFLSKDFKALEAEAQNLAKVPNINLLVYRYLGYSNFENGNYAGSMQALNTFMTKAVESRIIPLDYVYLAKVQLKGGDISSALANLNKAKVLDVARNLNTPVDGLGAIARELLTAKKYELAAQLYDFTQAGPSPVTLDFYYQGNAYLYDYQTKDLAKANPSKELLVKADSAYSRLLQRAPTTEAAWLSRVKVAKLLDTDYSKALATEPYLKFIDIVTVTKPDLAEKIKLV